ncbi:pleckstrin homology domain-containing family G member 5-like [Microcaecilia unicolor]|uniref:Pleckstrin homology domain-containing family G member 5-like n=1 Tax=Microcaecilia unicolor TaxID=1415580 RepID=A0A6P7YWH0_9AMPH|nr:pleckstrin homology domain-containing family G member 5-like [Microcaecilia unicolor]
MTEAAPFLNKWVPYGDRSIPKKPYADLKTAANWKQSDKTEELKKKLAFYSMFGLPRLSRDLRMFWEIREGNETSIRLESSWRDIVKGHESISRKNSHQQEAIWELLCTELSYMKKLRIITDLFICGLLNLHSSGFLNEVCVSSSTAKVG